jgi:F-type H+-transporting ATPase subunit a
MNASKMLKKFSREFSTNRLLFLTAFLLFFTTSSFASEPEHGGEKFKPGKMILHHIGDAHEWHIADLSATKHITIPLPIIAFSEGKLDVFMSSEFHHSETGSVIRGEGTNQRIYKLEHEHLKEATGKKVLDFSITKNAASIMLGGILLLLIFFSVAAGFRKNRGKAPKGIQSFFEPIILFIRDDIAISNLGEKKYLKYFPYLLTLFFFIWINNLLGLIPTGANASGNIAFTGVLAVLTLLITNISANKYYWKHIFVPSGVPIPMWVIIIPVEIIGILTKPFALMIRLFANITAGHIIILSLLSFIFIFESFLVGIPAAAFVVVMMFLELFVAALQAYIFTLLTALFIGTAIEDHHSVEHH